MGNFKVICDKTVDVEKNNSSTTTDDEKNQKISQNDYMPTLLVLIKGNIGSGVFAMGVAFKNGGLIVSAVLVIIVGCISTTCQHLMLGACNETARRMKMSEPLGYEESSGLCFEYGHPKFRKLAPIAGKLVVTFICITQCAFCCIYVMFISTNLKQIWDVHMPEISLSVVMAVVMIPLLLLSWIKDMRSLAPLAAIANFLILFCIIVVFVEGIPKITPDSVHKIQFVGLPSSIPLCFGTIVYSFEGIGLVSPVMKSYKYPERFTKPFGPLNVCMAIIGLSILFLGLVGYLSWGEEVQDSLTLNLDPKSLLGQATKSLISLAIVFSYPLQMLPALEIIKPKVLERLPQFPPVLLQFIAPSVISLILFLLAESVPHLGLFISLVGAVTSTTLALLIPPIMDTVTFYENYGLFKWRLIRNMAIIVFGLIGFCSGAYFSVRDIVMTFANPSSSAAADG